MNSNDEYDELCKKREKSLTKSCKYDRIDEKR